MWPFKKKTTTQSESYSYTQLDITPSFGDNLSLKIEDWISTKPLNLQTPNAESMGLPPVGLNENDVYKIAFKLSSYRELFLNPSDGVYCPICHIANIDSTKHKKPCPKCGRELLKFGWD